MKHLSKEEFERLIKLSHLSFDAETENLERERCNRVLAYVDLINELSLDHISPTFQIDTQQEVLGQSDEIFPSLDASKALDQAPAREGQYFAIPKMLGEKHDES